MRNKYLFIIAAGLMLVGCGKGNDMGNDIAQNTITPTPTTAPADTDDEKAPVDEPGDDAELITWEPVLAPTSGEKITDEEKLEKEKAILEKATLLFSGDENEGYYTDDFSYLTDGGDDASVVICFSCDDKSHGGWGVLGLKVNNEQDDIAAYSDKTDMERAIFYSASDLCDLGKIDSVSEITEFSLGAWNGGHIYGFYYLDAETTKEYKALMDEFDQASAINHTYAGELTNENAIDSAVAVYDYLKDTWGTGCLTGQMESTWKGSPDYEMNYIYDIAEKYPAIRGLDFMHNDFDGVQTRAQEWWEKGGIPTICWHTGADFASAYDECKADDLDWDKALTPGTKEYTDLINGMDRAVPALQALEDAGVPVLWRPFHELDGGWFWWSKGGSENFVKLWQIMYSRYTDYWGLDNLIWVYAYSHNGHDLASWYPGDDYVDLIGGDSYSDGANGDLYRDVEEVAAEGMPIVFHECGDIPTEEEMKESNSPWLFFMVWHTDYITDTKINSKEAIDSVYNSDYFITLDELPEF